MRSKIYLIWAVLLSQAIFVGYLAWLTLPGFYQFLTTCSAAGYDSDHYLANCANPKYGDYEHAAFYFGLEEEAIQRLKQADVLFFGNSRLQHGFSNSTTVEFFRQTLPASFYLFGFGYAEPYRFPLELYQHLQLRPKVIVVGVDGRLFESHVSDVVRFMKQDSGSRFRHIGKRAQQTFHRWLCGPDGLAPAWLTCGETRALFRSRSNGLWRTRYFMDSKDQRFRVPSAADPGEARKLSDRAAKFVRELGIPKDCIFFTTVPLPMWSPRSTELLAQELGVKSIEQSLDREWTSLDGHHLTEEESAIYASHILNRMRSAMEACLRR